MSRTKTDQRLIDELGEKAQKRLRDLDEVQGKYNALVEFILEDELHAGKPVFTSEVFGKVASLRARTNTHEVEEALRKEIDYLRAANLQLAGDARSMNDLRSRLAREEYERNQRDMQAATMSDPRYPRGF